VTRAEHARLHKTKDECRRGHPRSSFSTLRSGRQVCRECDKLRHRKEWLVAA
jgi:hypothetical protein